MRGHQCRPEKPKFGIADGQTATNVQTSVQAVNPYGVSYVIPCIGSPDRHEENSPLTLHCPRPPPRASSNFTSVLDFVMPPKPEPTRQRVRIPLGAGEGVNIDILTAAKTAVSAGKTIASAVAVPGLPVALDLLGAILEKAEVCKHSRKHRF